MPSILPAWWGAFLALVGEELAHLASITTIVSGIASVLSDLDFPAQFTQINNKLDTIQNNFAILSQQISQEFGQVSDEIKGLSDQTGRPQQFNVAVKLPAIPPPGYGGASTSAIADAVWAQPMPNAVPFTALEAQDSMMGHFFFLSNFNHPYSVNGNPGYAIVGADSEPATSFSGPNQGFLDFGTILPTDASIFAWANRVYPTSPWQHGANGTVFERDSLNGAILWYIDLTQAQFKATQAAMTTAVRVAPVWPGLAHVTLGSILALSDGLTVPGPLDGILVAITSVPTPTGFYPFGAVKSFVHLGGVVFASDRGDYELAQGLGPNTEVLTPRSLQRADHAIIRLKSGTVGTVTPWVIT